MYGLTSTLSTAAASLDAESGAIAVTNNNISNVNTAGYARQVVDLSTAALSGNGTSQNNGVVLDGYTSVRDQVLALSVNQKTSDQASLTTQSNALTAIQSSFSSTTTGLGTALSTFFSSFSALATSPQNSAAQQTALSSASGVVQQFQQAASAFTSASSSADQTVAGTVMQINQITSQIASLDQQLAPVLAQGQDGGSLQDQRDALTTQLAGLVGTSTFTSNTTPTLALSNGSPLVLNGQAEALHTTTDADGTTHVLDAAGNDLTDTITGGSLGGAIQVRDQTIPTLSASLNQLATEFATAVNTVQTSGYTAAGTQGTALFTLPASGSNAASGLTLNLTSASGLALSSTSAGDTSNVSNFVALQNQNISSGQTPSASYASLVQSIGTSASQASSSLTATTTALNQLTSLQSSESGVSVDEETTNLLRYQQAYSASAQVISTINNLFSIVLNMGTATT